MKKILAALVAAQFALTASFAGPRASDLEANCSPAAQVAAAPAQEAAGVRVTTKVTVDEGELARARAERDAAVAKATMLRQQHAAASRRAVASRQRQTAHVAELRRLTVTECKTYTDRSVQAAVAGVKDAVETAKRAEAETKTLAGQIAQTDAAVSALTERVTTVETRVKAVEDRQAATDTKVAVAEAKVEGFEKRLTFLECLVKGFWPGATPAGATTLATPTPAPESPAVTPAPEDATAPLAAGSAAVPTTAPAAPAAEVPTTPQVVIPQTPQPLRVNLEVTRDTWKLVGAGFALLCLLGLAVALRR